jgi:hypothetical protein
MKQKQMNRIANIMAGIARARRDLSGERPVELAMNVIMENFYSEEESLMTSERAAYLACMFLAWKDAGCPPLE